ncbi:MAG: cupin domain-containing protein [Thermodesulfobacteriota bacterium]|nr:cupin domain-containing protein [Thermodesulfobacteriota bacterium]
MSKTSFLRRASDMQQAPLARCHDGQGELQWTEVLHCFADTGRRLNFFHDDVLKPGVSVGIHHHQDDEEYYYVVSGNGIMTLDGEEFEVGPGDIAAVYAGGSHGLRNHTDRDLRILVVSVS